MSATPITPPNDKAGPVMHTLLSEAAEALSSERMVVTATTLLCLGTVIALAVFLRFDDWGLDLFRILMITLFTILPAAMYYVFMASRKSSLFQEFVSVLARLGLLEDRRGEEIDPSGSGEGRYFKRTRILSYIDRFEAVYGPVGTRQKVALLEATRCGPSSGAACSRSEPADGRILSPATAVPVFIATFLIGLGWVQFIPPWSGEAPAESAGNASLHSALLYNELPALFAFLGAYFFALQMLYRRYVVNDLRASAFVSVSIRIILGVIGAWLLQVVFGANAAESGAEPYWLLFASFVIGVFPPVLWRVMRDLSGRLLVFGKVVPSLDSDLPLSELDGLTIWHQTRLEEEDVENAFNMASADLIALTVNTKIPPERLVDWVDQAILYACFGRENDTGGNEEGLRSRLAGLGIGTASALLATVERAAVDAELRAELHDRLPQVQATALVARVERFGNIALIEHWRARHREAAADEGAGIGRAPTAAGRASCNEHRPPLGRLAALP